MPNVSYTQPLGSIQENIANCTLKVFKYFCLCNLELINMPLDNPKRHRNLISIGNETILWQYMNLEKFKNIIKSQGLFFRRASKFDDNSEGILPKKESEFNKLKGNRASFNLLQEIEKSNTIVNCWHINSNESAYMWENYGKQGIVIKSNLERIYLAFEDTNEIIHHSKIRYINYKNDSLILKHILIGSIILLHLLFIREERSL